MLDLRPQCMFLFNERGGLSKDNGILKCCMRSHSIGRLWGCQHQLEHFKQSESIQKPQAPTWGFLLHLEQGRVGADEEHFERA